MANFTGTSADDIIVGGNAADILNSNWSVGMDIMSGADGNDTYYVNSSDDITVEGDRAVNAAAGFDTVLSRATDYALNDNIEYLTLDNTLVATATPFGVIFVRAAMNGTGNGMDNVIQGNDNGNTLSGLGGNDWIFGNGGVDTINGDDGDDWLYGGTGNDTLNGGNNDDHLYGEADNDTMNGGFGNDTFVGGTGDDTMTGGVGNDIFYVDDVGDVVVEGVNSFLNGFDTVYASITETLDANVETLILTGASAISGYGNTLNNSITGNGAGNVIDGKTGADTMTGLAGNDFYYVDNVADTVVEANGVVDGIDTVFSSVTYTITDVDVESLFLTGVGANNGTGNASNNTVSGNGADNTLSGLGGGDTIYGNSGNDTLFGGTGSDTLSGGLGNDLLYAQDAVVANDGLEDRFVFNTTLDTAAVSKGLAPTNVDQIGMAFFGAGMEGVDDEFQLENSIFTALTAVGGGTVGTLANYYEGATATFTGDGTLDFAGIYLNTSNGYLYYNPTSNVANDSVLIAVVNNTIPGGSLSLSAEEFTLI